MTVVLRQHLDSETIHVPELRPLVGKDVEITVRELTQAESASMDRWQPLIAIAGQDLIDPAVFQDYRDAESRHQAGTP